MHKRSREHACTLIKHSLPRIKEFPTKAGIVLELKSYNVIIRKKGWKKMPSSRQAQPEVVPSDPRMKRQKS